MKKALLMQRRDEGDVRRKVRSETVMKKGKQRELSTRKFSRKRFNMEKEKCESVEQNYKISKKLKKLVYIA